jgi:starch synthase
MNIVHVASEMFPYIKTGGLADVVGSLARELARRGHQITVFLPGYRAVLEHADLGPQIHRPQRLRIEMGDMFMTGDLREFAPEKNLRIFLICREEFFDRKLPYGNGERDYEDNHHRFIFFCKAVVDTIRRHELNVDVLHTHDWPTGLLPLLVRVDEQRKAINLASRTVHTVHNLAFQGLFPLRSFYRTNLPDELRGLDGVEFYGQVSMMKAGLQFADRITTVSPNYAREILTPEFGCGLEGILQQRADDLSGIVNGIDTDVWNPEHDPLIPGHFSASDRGGKKLCRAALLKAHGFDPQFKGPIFGMVCRLTEQKGIQLLLANEEFLAVSKLKLIVIGSGDVALEEQMRELAARLPDKVVFTATVNEEASHLVEAGSDFFLMPSLFEPCGLNQMYSQAYGTIPIATRVGGLVDTIVDCADDPETGTGILIEPSAAGVLQGMRRALALRSDKTALVTVQANAMTQDFSWSKAVQTYEDFYAEIV